MFAEKKVPLIGIFTALFFIHSLLYSKCTSRNKESMMSRHVVVGLVVTATVWAAGLRAQEGDRGRWMNPEQRAEQQTLAMKEQLTLSEAQETKVREINLKYAQQLREARQKTEGDWEAMRAQMMSIRQAHDEALQAVLTQEQWKKWETYRGQMRGTRENRSAPPTERPSTDAGKKDKKKKKSDSRDANPNGN